jgi:hypothetical protein
MDDVRRLADKPIQHMLPAIVRQDLPVLSRMNLTIFTTEDDVGFVSSDNPCAWLDPEGPRRRPPSLQSKTIEVLMPVSLRRLALLSWADDLPSYQAAGPLQVDEANRLQQMWCEQYIVVRRDKVKPVWFT